VIGAVKTAADHFAECVFSEPGRCWRLVTDSAGRPDHCAEPVVWTGRTQLSGREGRVLTVWSCDRHREGLEMAQVVANE
jgi:hypothetical protein